MKTNTSLFFYDTSSCSIAHENITKEDPTSSMFADYYPGGMLMPRPEEIDGNTEFNTDSPYRYGYQGQERDAETDKEAFQLRLYDSRINRWLTTDPAGQYHSPYMAMGNNWMNGVDRDGAFWGELWNTIKGNGWHTNAELGALSFNKAFASGEMLDEVNISSISSANEKIGYVNSVIGLGLETIPKSRFLLGTFSDSHLIDFSDGFTNTLSSRGIKSVKVFDKIKIARYAGYGRGFDAAGVVASGVSMIVDTHSYYSGDIGGIKYSARTGANLLAGGIGINAFLTGASSGPAAIPVLMVKSAEIGYDVFVDPDGPVQRNFNFHFTAVNVHYGFSMFR